MLCDNTYIIYEAPGQYLHWSGDLQDGAGAVERAVRAHVKDVKAVRSPPRCDIGSMHVDLHHESSQSTHPLVIHTADKGEKPTYKP